MAEERGTDTRESVKKGIYNIAQNQSSQRFFTNDYHTISMISQNIDI